MTARQASRRIAGLRLALAMLAPACVLSAPASAAPDPCPMGFALHGKICVPTGIQPQCMTCAPAACRCLYKSDTCKAAPESWPCEMAADRCPATAPAPRSCTVTPKPRHGSQP